MKNGLKHFTLFFLLVVTNLPWAASAGYPVREEAGIEFWCPRGSKDLTSACRDNYGEGHPPPEYPFELDYRLNYLAEIKHSNCDWVGGFFINKKFEYSTYISGVTTRRDGTVLIGITRKVIFRADCWYPY